MIGRVKKWLGIEGVKLELDIPEQIKGRTGTLVGKIRFQSLNPQTVTGVRIVLIEKYTRGRGNEKLIDEYELGKEQLNVHFEVPAGEIVEIDFDLHFNLVKSEVDEFGDRNFLYRGIARAAKMLRSVRSEYRVEAEAVVNGVALNPFDRQTIDIV